MADSISKPTFSAHDDLRQACRYCASLAIVHRTIGAKREWLDTAIDNGTLTFIQHEDHCYGVTCQHVVDALARRNAKSADAGFVFATLKEGIYALVGEFRQPRHDLADYLLDVAITRLPNDFPNRIGKQFFRLQPDEHPKTEVRYAMAFGFPTGEKSVIRDGIGERMGMPCAQAVAEGTGQHFFSQLPDAPAIEHLSGMSGGPAFWSTEDRYGLLGFIYEGSRTGAAGDLIETPRIMYSIVPCDHQEFARWVEELDLKSAPITKIKPMAV